MPGAKKNIKFEEVDDEEEDQSTSEDIDPKLNDWNDGEGEYYDEDDDRKTEGTPLSELKSSRYNMSKKVNSTKSGVDYYLDNLLSKATGTAERSKEKIDLYKPKIKSGGKKVYTFSKRKIKQVDDFGDRYSSRIFTRNIFDVFINFVIKKPALILIIVGLLTLGAVIGGIIGFPPTMKDGEVQTKIQENIRGDFEVYLPQDHETKETLDEIQEDWSTDIIVVVVETDNAKPQSDLDWEPGANITNLAMLREISRFEEEFNKFRDANRNDDGVVFMLSISTVIKELNSTPPRLVKAIEKEYPNVPEIDVPGSYSIPDDQDLVDSIFNQIPPETKNKVVKDTNDDSIYDTAIILIGITQDIDQEVLVKDMRDFVKDFKNTKLTLTGPIPMTQAITKRTYEEFTRTLPAAIALVAGVLMLFHRNWRIVLITGIPVLCSLALTFGILGLLDMTLTPQVVLIAPILIALGVAYGLYIANRYSDEAQIEDKYERITVAVKTTGKAIFLSALTTAIGFASLMTVAMIPLQILGFGLSIGIMICYAITMLTVPSLVMILNYRKKGEIKVKEKLGNFPVVHRKKILGAAVILVLISVILLPAVQANMNFIKMAPQDEPVIIKMREYSDKFGGGQQGMLVVRGLPASPDNPSGSMKDADVLYRVDRLEIEINKVENTNAISIVDVMKMIKIPEEIIEGYPQLQQLLYILEAQGIEYNTSFWDVIYHDLMPSGLQKSTINIFYDTLSTEMRGMFVNTDYSKTLLYIDMPTMDVVNTKKAVLEVDEKTEQFKAGTSTSHLTGFGAILVAVNDMLVINSIQSTIIALILVLIVLAIIFKSLKYSAITLIPVCFVVILQPVTLISIGNLGSFINPSDPVFSGELNLFTAVIGSIIVGIGIDFGIHMTERIREKGMTLEGIRHGVSTSGMAFVEATVTMIGGLIAVFLINIPAIQEFILLVMILLTYSTIGALFILTAIYSVMVRMRETRKRRMEFFEKYGTDSGSDIKGENAPMKAGLDSLD